MSRQRGDINNDGVIDTLDATYILAYLVDLSGYQLNTAEDLAAADVNNDGAIDTLDATHILAYLVNRPGYGIDAMPSTSEPEPASVTWTDGIVKVESVQSSNSVTNTLTLVFDSSRNVLANTMNIPSSDDNLLSVINDVSGVDLRIGGNNTGYLPQGDISSLSDMSSNQVWYRTGLNTEETQVAKLTFKTQVNSTDTLIENIVYTYADSTMNDYKQVNMHLDAGFLKQGATKPSSLQIQEMESLIKRDMSIGAYHSANVRRKKMKMGFH